MGERNRDGGALTRWVRTEGPPLHPVTGEVEEQSLRFAAGNGDVGRVRELLAAYRWTPEGLTAKDGWGDTPLHWAARNGHAKVVGLLLGAKGWPPEGLTAENNWDRTPLHHAARNGHAKVVGVLLGAEGWPAEGLTAKNKWGETPLHLAARNGHAKVVGVLLGAEGWPGEEGLSVGDEDGNTPMDFAGRYDFRPKLAELAWEAGLDPLATAFSAETWEGDTWIGARWPRP